MDKKETWEEMIDRATYAVLKQVLKGELRYGVVEAFNIFLGWQREHGKLKG